MVAARRQRKTERLKQGLGPVHVKVDIDHRVIELCECRHGALLILVHDIAAIDVQCLTDHTTGCFRGQIHGHFRHFLRI